MELVIVMGLLAFLTINIALNIQNAFRARNRIQTKLADFSRVRDSLRIVEKDLNLAFHYRDLEEEFREEFKKAQKAANQKSTPQPAPGVPPGFSQPGLPQVETPDPKDAERKRNRINPVTQFIGSEDKMDFVTMNAGRLSQDLQQADFVEVGYELKDCRRPGSDKSAKCLVRRESPLVDTKVTDGGRQTVLLEEVSEFKLRYFGKGKQDWNSDWSSEAGEAVTKDAYPQAVEISVSIESGEEGKKRKVSMQIVAGIRFPNNVDKQAQTQSQGQALPGQPATGAGGVGP